jgi:hypothetical protein
MTHQRSEVFKTSDLFRDKGDKETANEVVSFFDLWAISVD